MELAILLTIVVLIFTSAFFIMGSIVEEKRAKKYKETVKQVVDMLRSYNREPTDYSEVVIDLGIANDDNPNPQEVIDWVTIKMTNNIFSEMMQYIPKEDEEPLTEQFDRER